jgi:hypothetical protein
MEALVWRQEYRGSMEAPQRGISIMLRRRCFSSLLYRCFSSTIPML